MNALFHTPRTPLSRRLSRQTGLTGLALLCTLTAVALVSGGGAWWWGQRASTLGSPAGVAATAASSPASAASGAASGPARRFGGANRVQPVSVGLAKHMDLHVTLNAIGNMAALNTAIVRAKVDGELRAIRFTEGQQVKAGQLLAEIDPRAFENALAQAQGQLARDQAQMRNAQIDLQRYQDLLAKDSIAEQQVATQDALLKQLKGTVEADQAAVDAAKLQLSYTKITAPISGKLGLRQADLGTVLHAGDASGLVTITQVQPIMAVFAVPEAQVPQINRHLRSKKDVMLAEVWDRDLKNKLGTGKVVSSDNTIDATTGTLKLKAEFPNTDGSLFPNQFVNVRITLSTLPDTLVIPITAIQRGAVGTFVYVVDADNAVAVRRVRLGATEGDWIAVTGEVAVNDKVVTDGADRLREGAKVDVVVPQRPGRAASAASAASTTPASTAAAPHPGPHPKGVREEGKVTPASSMPAAASGDLPPWFDRLPPEMQEKFKAMNPEERKAFIEKRREQRRQREAGGG